MVWVLVDIIGYTAAAFGTAIMLPQVVKTIRTKRVRDLSWGMLWTYFFNCVLWLVYGSMINAVPVVVCNAIAFLISIVQLVLKFRYSRH